jgi:septum formation protein
MTAEAERLILASASTARAKLLRAAGVTFAIEPAAIDEDALKQEARREDGSAIECASTLASAKACAVSHRAPGALVIGADQLLTCGNEWFDKPRDLAEARTHLLTLRGRSHVLATAACIAQGGEAVWQAASEPELTMRAFSDDFLDAYLASEGESLLASVGAYRLEGPGVQLFERIGGDHFAILGLPLIELLAFLRERGALAT